MGLHSDKTSIFCIIHNNKEQEWTDMKQYPSAHDKAVPVAFLYTSFRVEGYNLLQSLFWQLAVSGSLVTGGGSPSWLWVCKMKHISVLYVCDCHKLVYVVCVY